MLNFTFVQSVRILNGKGCISQIGELLKQVGYQKAFVVCDKILETNGVLDKIRKSFADSRISSVIYTDVRPDPPADLIEKGAMLCKAESCDCVIGIGGGSSIDTAKGINILRFNPGSVLEYAQKPMQHCSGLIAIPTTAGTGSELSNGAIVSDPEHDVKMPIMCLENMPEYAVLDPELTMTMPYRLTLLTGLDTFSHCYEAYTSSLSNPMTDLICEKMLETVVEYLPVALAEPENCEAREKMQYAASIGGWMLYNACAHVGHSIAHVLGAKLHIIHGAACAYDTSVVLKAISTAVPAKVRKIGELLGAEYTGAENPEEIGVKAAQAYQAFVKRLKLDPIQVDSSSIDDTLLAELVQSVVNEPFAGLTPVKIEEALAEKMLREILF